MADNLIIDLSEEFVTLHCRANTHVSEISVDDFFNNTELNQEAVAREIREQGFLYTELIFTLPIACINHQIVTLPDNVSKKEQMIFLGLEINKKLIGKNFGIQRLEVTKRTENDQALCDYMVLAPKPEVYKKLIDFSDKLDKKIKAVTPSFMLLGSEKINELRATVWLGEDRSEVVIWGLDNPLSITYIENSGDQVGDVNRYIVDYFDHVDNLNLSMVYLYGPKMRDAALGYGLSYPHASFDDPVKYLRNRLAEAKSSLNIAQETKLPKPPIAMTPRNIAFIVSALAVCLLLVMTMFNYARNFRLQRQLTNLQRKSNKYKKLLSEFRLYEKKQAELNAEKDFYLSITKRRTPWERILADISGLTPKEMWFERLNASKTKLLIAGKARTTEDVSSFSINLNSKSQYLKDALIIGTRDYEEGHTKLSEFQLTAKLQSPTGEYQEL